jgi:hypothetical protein
MGERSNHTPPLKYNDCPKNGHEWDRYVSAESLLQALSSALAGTLHLFQLKDRPSRELSNEL